MRAMRTPMRTASSSKRGMMVVLSGATRDLASTRLGGSSDELRYTDFANAWAEASEKTWIRSCGWSEAELIRRGICRETGWLDSWLRSSAIECQRSRVVLGMVSSKRSFWRAISWMMIFPLTVTTEYSPRRSNTWALNCRSRRYVVTNGPQSRFGAWIESVSSRNCHCSLGMLVLSVLRRSCTGMAFIKAESFEAHCWRFIDASPKMDLEAAKNSWPLIAEFFEKPLTMLST